MAELVQAQQLCSGNLWEQLSEFTMGRLIFFVSFLESSDSGRKASGQVKVAGKLNLNCSLPASDSHWHS